MRQVLAGIHAFGPLFWAAKSVPKGWEEASRKYGVATISGMTQQVQDDVATLSATEPTVPCESGAGTLKCEACAGGCQLWDSINLPVPPPPPPPVETKFFPPESQFHYSGIS